MTASSPSFRPVMGSCNICLGHIVRTARGWIAYDRRDREVGTFATEDEAADALLQPIAD